GILGARELAERVNGLSQSKLPAGEQAARKTLNRIVDVGCEAEPGIEVDASRILEARGTALDVHRRHDQSLDRKIRPRRPLRFLEQLLGRCESLFDRDHAAVRALSFGNQALEGPRGRGLLRMRSRGRDPDRAEDECQPDQPRTAVKTPEAARLAAKVSSRTASSTMN